MAYRIEVDQNLCISSGMCVADAPGLIRFDDDNLAELIPGGEQPPDQALVRLARGCPSGALQVFDGDEPVNAL
jgi:ferredoxin